MQPNGTSGNFPLVPLGYVIKVLKRAVHTRETISGKMILYEPSFREPSVSGIRNRPEFRSCRGTGGIWAGTGSGPVPVDLAGTRPVPRLFHDI